MTSLQVIQHQELPTLAERERLNTFASPRLSAFTPRPCERLVKLRRPTSTLDIECRQFTKTSQRNLPKIDKNVQYRLWLEAGNFPPPFPPNVDPNYNSNVWRNFRKNYGFFNNANDCDMSEVIAAIYPLTIPPPSTVGNYTFEKYIAETKLFTDPRYKSIALERSKTDLAEFRRLKLKSDMRNPALDERGNILPPENFKRYLHRLLPPPTPRPQSPDEGFYKIDIFGQISLAKSEPKLWKLSHKLNHPAYEKVKEAVMRRKKIQNKMAVINQGGQLNIELGK